MMQLRSILLVFFVGFTLLASSCNPYYYAPVTQNIPLNRQKGDFTANVSGGDMFAVSGSYAVSNSIAVLGTYGSLRHEDESDGLFQYDYVTKILNYEIGGGFYRPLGGYGSLELYGLGGGGKVDIDDEDFGYDENISFFKFAFQPVIGVKTEWIELGFTPKLSYLYFTNYDSPYYETFTTEESILGNLNNDGGRFVFEPAVMLRAGFKNVKVFSLLCIPESLDNDYFEQYVYPQNFAIGITVAFPGKKAE